MEREIYLEKNEPDLKEGVIYLRFISDTGEVQDIEDENFKQDLDEISSHESYINMCYFFLEKDMNRGKIPNLRVFTFGGSLFKLTDLDYILGFKNIDGIAKEIGDDGLEILPNIRYLVKLQEARAVEVNQLPKYT